MGRRTQPSATRRGRAILKQGNQRIFELPLEQWDGQRHLVVYSLPEEKRELGNELRKQLQTPRGSTTHPRDESTITGDLARIHGMDQRSPVIQHPSTGWINDHW